MTSLSLVICTRNRAHLLVRALAAVEAAAKPPGFELVVVDNGSGDATGAVIGAHAARAGQPVLTVAEPRVGLSRARNAGVAAASGEVVAFTDDDCLIRPDHLTGVAAAFAELPIAFCGGRVVAADPADSPVALNLDPTFRWLPPGRPLRPGVVQGANLAVRADALRAAAVGPGPGPFDEALGAGAGARCEDVELCARLLAAGRRGAHLPWLVVEHAHGRRGLEATALEAANDRARGAFYLRRLLAGERAYLPLWAADAARRVGAGAPGPRRLRWAAAVGARELLGASAELARMLTGRSRPPRPAAEPRWPPA